MSDFDPNASARWGQGATRAGRAAIDQGLRSYMLGVYNNMVVGLAITGVVALGVHMLAVTTDPALGVPVGRHLLLTSFGVTLYTTPLKWVVMLAPLAFVFFFSFRINQMSASAARGVFPCFRGGDGFVSLDHPAHLYRDIGCERLLRDSGGLRRLEPLWLHDAA